MDWIYSWKNSGYNSARVTSGGSVTTRPCLINGGMPKGERFFRQSRQIFAGGLTPGKRMQRRVAEKDPSFGRFGIFQTRPKYRSTTYPPALLPHSLFTHGSPNRMSQQSMRKRRWASSPPSYCITVTPESK